MILEILQNAVMVTGFVVIMMLLIECINIYTKGTWKKSLQSSGWKQLLMAVLLGLTPGCLGGFAVVSLFSHGMLSFGAMVACMIATFGDEAFVLYAVAPETALWMTLILFVIAMGVGGIVQLLFKNFTPPFTAAHWELHQVDLQDENILGSLVQNVKHFSWKRGIIFLGIVAFALCILCGGFEHGHEMETAHTDHMSLFTDERGLNLLFVVLCFLTACLVLKVKEHFLQEHLWHHIVKEHFLRIFLWTLGVVLLVVVLEETLDFNAWVQNNRVPVLLLAICIGLIPQSGPHILFISLFSQGVIPFSVLLTNSIVQEGHAGLPLFAESKKGFFWMKGISVIVGLIVGLLGYFLDF